MTDSMKRFLIRAAWPSSLLAKRQRAAAERHAPEPETECALHEARFHDRMQNDPLVARLRRAILHEELDLVFQPLVDARSKRLIGAEALLRWHAPEIGTIAPEAVVLLAEQSDLIHALTLSVLNQALARFKRWTPAEGSLRLSINLSPQCLEDPRFPQCVAAILKAWSVEPGRLEFGLTPSEAITDVRHAAEILGQLRALGIRIALDGFGRASSSLERLKHLPVDCLKIDSSFVRGFASNAVDRAIVEGLCSMARKLGCETVATGIESEDSLNALIMAGCDVLQGYEIGAPMPADEFAESWLTP